MREAAARRGRGEREWGRRGAADRAGWSGGDRRRADCWVGIETGIEKWGRAKRSHETFGRATRSLVQDIYFLFRIIWPTLYSSGVYCLCSKYKSVI
jgi:hypothetical protein